MERSTTLGVSAEAADALHRLEELSAQTKQQIRQEQLPEPGWVLDLDSREGELQRQFKHIHSLCSLHTAHLKLSNHIKTAYIVDSYLEGIRLLNPIMIYNAARSLLELHAWMFYVVKQLREKAAAHPDDWLTRGQEFFNQVVQARYGTTDSALREKLVEGGLPKQHAQLVKIAKCRKGLAAQIGWIEAHYETLCDYVHHNFSSQRTASSLTGVGKRIQLRGGGFMLLSDKSLIVQYEFPSPSAISDALEVTAARAYENAIGICMAHSSCPDTPFTAAECERFTGSASGIRITGIPISSPPSGVGRNQTCPCGSGVKYKRCHGA